MSGELGVVLALLVQTAGLFYWGGRLKATVDHVQRGQADHEDRIRGLERE